MIFPAPRRLSDNGAGAVVDAEEIDPHNPPPQLRIALLHRVAGDVDTRVEDRDVDATEGLGSRRHHPLYLVQLRHVGRNGDGAPATTFDLSSDGLDLCQGTRRAADCGTRPGVAESDRPTDPPPRSGNDSYLALEGSTPIHSLGLLLSSRTLPHDRGDHDGL